MKLLISTPCYGGQVMERYQAAITSCVAQANLEGLLERLEIHLQGKESLIHRGRDRSAAYFLKGGFDKLLSIDADIDWTYNDFKRIITSPHDIVGGMYPLKTFPIVANFNPLPERGTELIKSERMFDFDAYREFCAKYADQNGLAEVRHLATGFLCVTRKVFEALAPKVKVYRLRDAASGTVETVHHFYPSGVNEEEGILESEDWAFSRLAREAGFRVMLDTKISLGHTGNHTYRMGQFFGESGTGLTQK